MVQTHHRDSGKTLVINNATDEDGYLKIFGKDIDVIILGDSTHEGGDVSIYEDASNHKSFSFDADAGNLILGNTSSETASLQIFGKNADALILGDATHEGGDVSIYRDTSGNKQLSLDADAASNALALSVYGGVVAQNYLTVGQATLNLANHLYVVGQASFTAAVYVGNDLICGEGNRGISLSYAGIWSRANNQTSIPISIGVSGTDSTDHTIKLQIDSNDIIVAQATGDGAGGITNKAIGVFGVTPQVQQAHIADADGTLADITTKFNQLKADIEGFGFNATS